MTSAHFDVVVIGGGPAGLAAAISIRSKVGASVLVVDASTLTPDRVGESCPPDTILLLTQLGVAGDFYQAGHETCPGYASVWGRPDIGYNDSIVNPMGPSWRLHRNAFDTMLANKAEELGAKLAWATRFLDAKKLPGESCGYALKLVEGAARTHQQIQAGFVIDATGYKARFAAAIGVKKPTAERYFATIRFATRMNGGGSRRVLLEAVPEGWWYHAALPRGRMVTMVVSERERLAALREAHYQGFSEALARTAFVGSHVAEFTLGACRYHTRAIHCGTLPSVEGGDWMAIGDAAASFDPIAAQGIYKGLGHGILAATKVSAWFNGDCASSSPFSQQVRRQHAIYLRNRDYLYGLERRWSETSFWSRRHAATQVPAENEH